MINSIWIGRNSMGYCSTSQFELIIKDGDVIHKKSSDNDIRSPGRLRNEDFLDLLGIHIEKYDVCQITFNTETQKMSIKKKRKEAWYLTKHKAANIVIARYWDGKKWYDKPEYVYSIGDESYFIIDETPISSPLLRYLE